MCLFHFLHKKVSGLNIYELSIKAHANRRAYTIKYVYAGVSLSMPY